MKMLVGSTKSPLPVSSGIGFMATCFDVSAEPYSTRTTNTMSASVGLPVCSDLQASRPFAPMWILPC